MAEVGLIRTGKALARMVLPSPVYRKYRQLLVHRIVRHYTPRTIEIRYGGVPLRVSLQDPLAEGWYLQASPQLPELVLLEMSARFRRGARMFDLGAHQAVLALTFASLVGPDGQVVAVEGEPHNTRVATINRDLNQAQNLTLLHAVVADIPGNLHFAEGLNGHVQEGSRIGTVVVQAVTIDQLAATHGPPDIVVLDVEGFEARALIGAAQTIARRRTDFLIEVHRGAGLEETGATVADVFERLENFSLDVLEDRDEPISRSVRRINDASQAPNCRFHLLARPRSLDDERDVTRPRT